MKRFFELIILCAVLTFVAAFANAASPRVASLSPALTELIYRLGAEKHLVARSSACNMPEEVKSLPEAGSFAVPNIERCLDLKVEVLLTNDLINPGVIRQLEESGVKVINRQCRTLGDYREWARQLGELLGAQDAAKLEIKRIEEGEAELAKLPKLPLKVLCIVWDRPMLASGAGSLPDFMIGMVGAENVAKAIKPEYFKASPELLMDESIDCIWFLTPERDYRNADFWRDVPAVKSGRIITGIDPDLAARPGPRLLDGIKLLRSKLEGIKR